MNGIGHTGVFICLSHRITSRFTATSIEKRHCSVASSLVRLSAPNFAVNLVYGLRHCLALSFIVCNTYIICATCNAVHALYEFFIRGLQWENSQWPRKMRPQQVPLGSLPQPIHSPLYQLIVMLHLMQWCCRHAIWHHKQTTCQMTCKQWAGQ